MRTLQCVNGWPTFVGRVVATATMYASSVGVIRRRGPGPQCGSNAVNPLALNPWITSRTWSASALSTLAISGASIPPADARTISARRSRTAS